MEVLMAVMIMGIGIVGLAALFPVSVHRAIRATQLTNGTILKQNAEQIMEVHNSIALLPEPMVGTDVTVIDPHGRVTLSDGFGFEADGTKGTTRRFHGFDATVITDTMQQERLAKQMSFLGTTWESVVEDEPTVNNGTQVQITLGSSVDLNDFQASLAAMPEPAIEMRVLLLDVDNNVQVRSIESVAGNVLTCTAGEPAVNNPNAIVTAKVEVKAERYSWLASVRKRNDGDPLTTRGTGAGDIVVFFNRGFTKEEERIYEAAAGGTSREVIIGWDENATAAPFVKNGGFLFDPDNGFWYPIVEYSAVRGPKDARKMTLTLRDARQATISNAILMRGIVDVYPFAF